MTSSLRKPVTANATTEEVDVRLSRKQVHDLLNVLADHVHGLEEQQSELYLIGKTRELTPEEREKVKYDEALQVEIDAHRGIYDILLQGAEDIMVLADPKTTPPWRNRGADHSVPS